MDADLAKVDNQHEKILAADVKDLEEYVRKELFELSDEFGDNKEGYDEHLASIYGIGDGKYYQNIADYLEDIDWDYVYKVVVGLGWKIIREDDFGSYEYINELYEPEVKERIKEHGYLEGIEGTYHEKLDTINFFNKYEKCIIFLLENSVRSDYPEEILKSNDFKLNAYKDNCSMLYVQLACMSDVDIEQEQKNN